ncbi:DUF6683 family protein [Leptotrichia trevisanii]|uniref:DUF6683 family protein n=1 Tax=Leptotrichia trevisanii TaxID=109328 RepID=UPI0003F89B0F|nr:DUF6683 family protein [Leptotrichia trevisanii]
MKINLKKLFVTTVIGAGLFVSRPAHAFAGYDFDYNLFHIQNDTLKRTFDYYNQVTGTNDILEKSSSSKSTGSSKSKSSSSSSQTSSKPKPAKKAKITFKSDGSTRGLDYLVNNYPSKQRAEAKIYLKKMYDSFPQVARSVGIPTNDLSSGMVAILAGAYMAYNNVSLNDSYMKPMAKQFKEALESVTEFDKMSDSDKKYIYDQMVIIGMTLAVNQSQNQQNPNAKVTAQLRRAGKEVLEGVLKVNASKVKITSSGLVY